MEKEKVLNLVLDSHHDLQLYVFVVVGRGSERMLSTSDVVAKPAHGEEKKSENGEDGGNNSKACEQ